MITAFFIFVIVRSYFLFLLVFNTIHRHTLANRTLISNANIHFSFDSPNKKKLFFAIITATPRTGCPTDTPPKKPYPALLFPTPSIHIAAPTNNPNNHAPQRS